MTDPFLWGIVLIPPFIALLAKLGLRWSITWPEFIVQGIMGLAALSMVWAIGNATVGMDTETINGAVTGKHAWRFSCPTNTSNPCRNDYQCHCHKVCSGSGKDKSCRTECDTCYEYDWEQNWLVETNLFNAREFEIDRVDDQGAREPARYTEVKPGDPASSAHGYKNWVKASSRSLFKEDGAAEERFRALIPAYPQAVKDYYKVDRVLAVNTTLANQAAWNDALARSAAKLGPRKQVNFVLLIVKGTSRDFAAATRRNWEGFKKNDAVIVIGLDNAGRITWAESMSWSKASIFDVAMRGMIIDMEGTPITSVDPKAFFAQVEQITARDFVRRPMKEFEYLKGDIPPPAWLHWLSAILAVLIGCGLTYWFHVVDMEAALSNLFSKRSNRFNRY